MHAFYFLRGWATGLRLLNCIFVNIEIKMLLVRDSSGSGIFLILLLIHIVIGFF